MNNLNYQVLEINLDKGLGKFHSFSNLGDLLGGLGLGLQLLKVEEKVPQVVLSIGLLNGLFPFASKYCCLGLNGRSFIEAYGSGRLALMMRFAQIDALLIKGTARLPVWVSVRTDREIVFYEDSEGGRQAFAREGLAGRKSTLTFSDQQSLSDNYFVFETNVGRQLYLSNLCGLMVTADQVVKVAREKEYQDLFQEILKRGQELEVTYSDKPSCAICPAGCDLSAEIEQREELILSHCLVTCGFAKSIYESEALVFACLNSLGYNYKHEDLELVVSRVERLRQRFI